MTRQTIPTPEGVTIEVELAGLGSRSVATLLDLLLAQLVWGSAAGALSGLLAFVPGDGGEFLVAFIGTFFVGYFLTVFGLVMVTRGNTPGKRTMGLRVVGADGRNVTPKQHFVRTLALYIDILTLAGPLMMFFRKDGRRLGDWMAGTIVVHGGLEGELVDPWLRQDWQEREWKVLELSPAVGARFDQGDLALLRDIILRREMAPADAKRLHHAAAAGYCARAGVAPTEDPRVALKDIFLFLREARGV